VLCISMYLCRAHIFVHILCSFLSIHISLFRMCSDIPRGQLVELSMEFPHLIDAAFVRFSPQWRDREEELMNTTIVKEPIKFDDFNEYKAIIDIDGNNWRYVMSTTILLIHLMMIT